GAVRGGRQIAVLEQVEVTRLRLPEPAARERELRGDVVGLPAVARRQDLDTRRGGRRVRARGLELGEERGVVGRVDRGVTQRVGEVVDRGDPLPVDEQR